MARQKIVRCEIRAVALELPHPCVETVILASGLEHETRFGRVEVREGADLDGKGELAEEEVNLEGGVGTVGEEDAVAVPVLPCAGEAGRDWACGAVEELADGALLGLGPQGADWLDLLCGCLEGVCTYTRRLGDTWDPRQIYGVELDGTAGVWLSIGEYVDRGRSRFAVRGNDLCEMVSDGLYDLFLLYELNERLSNADYGIGSDGVGENELLLNMM
ncbi:hypothetical protein DFH09DRAFT_1079453 [Mycena vulgaris]|nr:hypothetical protein DFH09DRAFT_1079453 [Mycena vulgaris]